MGKMVDQLVPERRIDIREFGSQVVFLGHVSTEVVESEIGVLQFCRERGPVRRVFPPDIAP